MDIKLKEIERLLIWLVPLAILSAASKVVVSVVWARVGGAEPMDLSADLLYMFTTLQQLVLILPNLAIAVGLYFFAKKISYTSWVWSLFGLVFGLWALATLFIYRI